MSRFKVFVVIFLMVFTGLSCIHPIFPDQQILQHIGTLLIVVVLFSDIKFPIFSNISFLGIALFGIVHIVGARYIYSYVPYNDFLISNFGFNVQDYFGWERNHYDRWVHFSFGLFILPSLYEFVVKKFTHKKAFALFVAWLMLQSFSLVYELFEWSLSILMSANDAENYNGQQGDVWDAQKDMALAMLGSTISSVANYLKIQFSRKK